MDLHYIHDALGRRIGKVRDGNLEKGWLYADALNPIAELDGAGNVRATFIYGTRAHVPDAMVMNDGTVYRLITDHLGSVRLVVNAETGEVVQRVDYDAFGRVLQDTNPDFQPFGFAGGLYDDDTGLVRFGARDYDAYAGRWTAKDRILFDAGDPNLYAYAGSDPANYIDPDGLAIDTVADIGFIGYDLYRIWTDNIIGDCGNLASNLAALGFDVLGAAIPFATGLGAAVRLKRLNKLTALEDAKGAHTVFKRGDDGRISGYTTFDAAGNPTKRFRGTGRPHGGQEPPLILERRPGAGANAKPKVPRQPRPDELPLGY